MQALDSVLSTAEMKALILQLGVSSAVGCYEGQRVSLLNPVEGFRHDCRQGQKRVEVSAVTAGRVEVRGVLILLWKKI